MTTFAQKAYDFYVNIELPSVPSGIVAMNPYHDKETRKYSKIFLDKYFSDRQKRIFVFGINPGRFGAGLTGVTFTDPVALNRSCGIPNHFPPRRETSSDFVYRFIHEWGGAGKFYQKFFLTAVCPLGFTKDGNNYNFYDDAVLLKTLKPFLIQTIRQQLSLGAADVAIVFGSGKNYKIFCELNQENCFFKKIYALEHPRFIMQYKRKKIDDYIQKYKEVFSEAGGE